MNTSEIIRAYIAGWDAGRRQLLDTLATIPAKHVAAVIATMRSEANTPTPDA